MKEESIVFFPLYEGVNFICHLVISLSFQLFLPSHSAQTYFRLNSYFSKQKVFHRIPDLLCNVWLDQTYNKKGENTGSKHV